MGGCRSVARPGATRPCNRDAEFPGFWAPRRRRWNFPRGKARPVAPPRASFTLGMGQGGSGHQEFCVTGLHRHRPPSIRQPSKGVRRARRQHLSHGFFYMHVISNNIYYWYYLNINARAGGYRRACRCWEIPRKCQPMPPGLSSGRPAQGTVPAPGPGGPPPAPFAGMGQGKGWPAGIIRRRRPSLPAPFPPASPSRSPLVAAPLTCGNLALPQVRRCCRNRRSTVEARRRTVGRSREGVVAERAAGR